jgi:excisionase family DNA binding protein
MSEERRYLRASELARSLGVTVRTVRRWIAMGVIPSVKVGGARCIPLWAVEKTSELSFLEDVEGEDGSV